jgi:ABC-2 type transport system ATP-binding protein
LPEHFRFHEWLRAGEFLDLHGRLYGMSRQKRATVIPDLLELVGLADQHDRKLSTFSKGMLQRVGLAQSLLNDPELVFLDEPTSGLDPLGRRLIRDIIDGLRQEGTAVFLNSHLLSEVEKTCDRVAFIREGKLLRTVTLTDFEAGSSRLMLRLGNVSPGLIEDLKRQGATSILERPDGLIELVMPDEAHIPRLAHWLVQHGYELYQLTPQRRSLEEIFVQIVGEPQVQGAAVNRVDRPQARSG